MHLPGGPPKLNDADAGFRSPISEERGVRTSPLVVKHVAPSSSGGLRYLGPAGASLTRQEFDTVDPLCSTTAALH